MSAEDRAREQVRREIQFRAAESAAKAGRTRSGWDGEFPTPGASEARARLAAYYDAMAWEWTAILELTEVPDAGDNGRTPERARCVRCDHDPEDHRGHVGCAVAWPMPDGMCPCTLSTAEATDPGWAQWIDPDDGSTPIGFLQVRVRDTVPVESQDGPGSEQ